MSHNYELENQDLHLTTMRDGRDSTNLPAEELPEQDLDAVSGGAAAILPVLPFVDELEDVGDAANASDGSPPPSEPLEEVDGLAGDIVEAPELVQNAAENIKEGVENIF